MVKNRKAPVTSIIAREIRIVIITYAVQRPVLSVENTSITFLLIDLFLYP